MLLLAVVEVVGVVVRVVIIGDLLVLLSVLLLVVLVLVVSLLSLGLLFGVGIVTADFFGRGQGDRTVAEDAVKKRRKIM